MQSAHESHSEMLPPAYAFASAAAPGASLMSSAAGTRRAPPSASVSTMWCDSNRLPRSPASNYPSAKQTRQRFTSQIMSASRRGATPSNVRPRPRPLTNTERARNFRLREKAHEQSLVAQLEELRRQIAQLESSRDLLKQHALMTRTNNGGSLEKIARELYLVFRFGLESVDPTETTSVGYSYTNQQTRMTAQFKESFMRSIVDQDTQCGDLVGVDTLIEQWRKHTLSYSKFEIEVDRVEPIAGSGTNPIIVVHSKLYARYSRETLPIMFPFVLEERPDLAAKFIDRDITFDCISRFTFSEWDQITNYQIEVNLVEAFVKAVGSARDVAELMEFSVVTPYTTLGEAKPMRRVSSDTYHYDTHLGTRSYVKEPDSRMQRDEWRAFDYAEHQHGSPQFHCLTSYEGENEDVSTFDAPYWS